MIGREHLQNVSWFPEAVKSGRLLGMERKGWGKITRPRDHGGGTFWLTAVKSYTDMFTPKTRLECWSIPSILSPRCLNLWVCTYMWVWNRSIVILWYCNTVILTSQLQSMTSSCNARVFSFHGARRFTLNAFVENVKYVFYANWLFLFTLTLSVPMWFAQRIRRFALNREREREIKWACANTCVCPVHILMKKKKN